LEDPARLAEWVLRDNPGWTRERIEKAMQGERPTQVNLRDHLSLVIFYDTVHVNSEGIVHFVGFPCQGEGISSVDGPGPAGS
jgi:murein L,D-transpeptidase YcbB/YkuD